MHKIVGLLAAAAVGTVLLGCGQDFLPSDEDFSAYFEDAELSAIHYEYEYDAEDRPTVKRALNAEDELQWFETYDYDEAGNLSRSSRYDNSDPAQLVYYYLYEWTEGGDKSRESYYSAADLLQFYRSFEYDESANLTRESMFDGEDSLEWYALYEYDEEGRKTQTTRFGADAAQQWRIAYLYEG